MSKLFFSRDSYVRMLSIKNSVEFLLKIYQNCLPNLPFTTNKKWHNCDECARFWPLSLCHVSLQIHSSSLLAPQTTIHASLLWSFNKKKTKDIKRHTQNLSSDDASEMRHAKHKKLTYLSNKDIWNVRRQHV